VAENIANTIARQLFAMAAKKRDTNLAEMLANERYQRTFTDAYDPPRMRSRFKPVDEEQKKSWEILAARK
jgi:hypothetical protein